MRLLVFQFLILILSVGVFAQNDSNYQIINKLDSANVPAKKKSKLPGIYMNCNTGYTVVDNLDAFLIGCKGGWIFSRYIVAGIGGTFYMNGPRPNPMLGSDKYAYTTEVAYAYLFLETIIFPQRKLHLNIPLNIGSGAISYTTDFYNTYTSEWEYQVVDSDSFGMLETGLEAEVTLNEFLRMGFAATYRFTTSVDVGITDRNQQYRQILPHNAASNIAFVFSAKIGLYKK